MADVFEAMPRRRAGKAKKTHAKCGRYQRSAWFMKSLANQRKLQAKLQGAERAAVSAAKLGQLWNRTRGLRSGDRFSMAPRRFRGLRSRRFNEAGVRLAHRKGHTRRWTFCQADFPVAVMARVLAVNAQGKAMDVVEAEGRLAPVATARSFLALL